MRIVHSVINRRAWMRTSAAVCTAGLLNHSRGLSAADKYGDLDTDRFLGPVQVLAEVRDVEVFTEGPAVDRAGNVFFTNVPVSKILKWDPATEQLSVFRENSNKSNGLYFDPAGRLLACEGGAGHVTRRDMKTGRVEVLASQFNGFPLAAPNDLCRDKQGRVYFTSRPGADNPTKGNVNVSV